MSKEIRSLLIECEKISNELVNYQQKQYDNFESKSNRIIELISKILKCNLDNPNINSNDIEQVYYDLTDYQYKMGHKDYGNRIENNIRSIVKNVFGNIVGYEKKVGDVIISKDNKKLVIEIKSYIDDTTEKSPQSIKTLLAKKNEIEKSGKGYEKYIVFAHTTWYEKILRNCFNEEWIILLSYHMNNEIAAKPIWEIKNYEKYYPLSKVINCINNFKNYL